jgi:hypothetical protein
VNAGQALGDKTRSLYQSVWEEGFADLPYDVLEAAFRKTLRECKFWPVKVADVRERVDRTRETAVLAAAELEWERVLELRRLCWNPDMPGGFSRGMPKLSQRVAQAARAAGVFRDHESGGALHVWAKKRFIESYLAWEELEQDRFLLPTDELKNLLGGAAQAKALPAASVDWNELHARGLAYAGELKGDTSQQPDLKRAIRAIRRVSETPRIVDVDGRAAKLERQKKFILQKYPPAEKATVTP